MNRWDRLLLSEPFVLTGRALSHVLSAVDHRRSRPWLATVAVPLAMTATMLLYLWWIWPELIACAWWWADRTWRWAWIVPIEEGALGAQWAYLGIYALYTWPLQRVVVAVVWIAYPLALAAVSVAARWSNGRREPYAGY